MTDWLEQFQTLSVNWCWSAWEAFRFLCFQQILKHLSILKMFNCYLKEQADYEMWPCTSNSHPLPQSQTSTAQCRPIYFNVVSETRGIPKPHVCTNCMWLLLGKLGVWGITYKNLKINNIQIGNPKWYLCNMLAFAYTHQNGHMNIEDEGEDYINNYKYNTVSDLNLQKKKTNTLY